MRFLRDSHLQLNIPIGNRYRRTAQELRQDVRRIARSERTEKEVPSLPTPSGTDVAGMAQER